MIDLAGLYQALAALPVRVNDELIPAFALDALPSAPSTAQLPARLISPARASPIALSPLTLGGRSASLTLTLVDLYLLAPLGRGRGLAEMGMRLLAYQSAYLDAVCDGMRLTPTAYILDVVSDAGVFAYPDGGEAQYYGVEMRVTVRDSVASGG